MAILPPLETNLDILDEAWHVDDYVLAPIYKDEWGYVRKKDHQPNLTQGDKMTTENLMTLTTRDVFSFAALPAIIDEYNGKYVPEGMTMERYLATLSYRIADAMIAERDDSSEVSLKK